MYQCYLGNKLFDLSEEILYQLLICGDSLDSFTIERHLSALESIRSRFGLNEQEYFVMASLLTRRGEEQRALQLLEEGREKHTESLLLHGAVVQTRVSLWQKKEAQFQFDRGWFEHPANLETEPYRAAWQASLLTIGPATIALKREIRGIMTVRKDACCTVEFGPFRLEYSYEKIVNYRLRTDTLIAETLAEAVFMEDISELEHRYLVDVMGSPPSHAFDKVFSRVEIKGISEEKFIIDILELPGRTFAMLRTAGLVGSGPARKHALDHLKNQLLVVRHKWDVFAEVPDAVIAQYWAARNLLDPGVKWLQ